MPELRYDPHGGGWTLIAPERGARPRPAHHTSATPGEDDPRCPFCPGNEGETPPEVDAIRESGEANAPGWRVRCVANKYPAIRHGASVREGGDMFLVRRGGGRHEVAIDSPHHTKGLADLSDAHTGGVLRLLQRRARALMKTPGVRCVSIFKNHGAAAGASILHSHIQILALPVRTGRARRKRDAEAAFHAERKEALLERMIRSERARGERMVETGAEGAAVFCPWGSRLPYLACIAPWPTEASFLDSPPRTLDAVGGALARTLRRYKARLRDPPITVSFFLEAGGADEGARRWHIELFPRLVPLAGLEAGLGTHINEVAPERAAHALRAASPRLRPQEDAR